MDLYQSNGSSCIDPISSFLGGTFDTSFFVFLNSLNYFYENLTCNCAQEMFLIKLPKYHFTKVYIRENIYVALIVNFQFTSVPKVTLLTTFLTFFIGLYLKFFYFCFFYIFIFLLAAYTFTYIYLLMSINTLLSLSLMPTLRLTTRHQLCSVL